MDIVRVVISGSLGGVIVRTPAQNARYVDVVPDICIPFPIFITSTTLIVTTRILVG